MACTSLQRAAATLGAVALLAALGGLPSAAQAATCFPGKRGTLNDDNTFTVSTTGADYRVVCSGDADGRQVTNDDLDAALGHTNADPIGDADVIDRFVMALSNASWDFRDDELGGLPPFVVIGNVEADSGWNGVQIRGNGMQLWNDWNIDSHASVRTEDGGVGIAVNLWGADPYYGTLRVRNFGSVETTGGGPSDGDRRGRGIDVTSDGGDGDVEVVNESGGSVVTRGPGARGVTAGALPGSATAINHGTITTHGDGFLRRGSLQTSDALYAWVQSPSGVARSVNESSGVIEANGDGARGIGATTWKDAGAITIATNKGQVTTRGDRIDLDGHTRSANGVHASTSNGLARATNEAGATVTTAGKGAVGLYAGNSDGVVPAVSGRAEVENSGTIETTGDEAGTTRSHGMHAFSQYGSAYAANHERAVVLSFGRGARGVMASNADRRSSNADIPNTRHGAPDEVVYALNHGGILTTGDGFHSDDREFNADGLAAFSGGYSPAVAVNALEGLIRTTGTGAKGVWASAFGKGGAATATNRGYIETVGDAYRADREGPDNDTYQRADGLSAYSLDSDATAANEVGGVIDTYGAVAMGVHAESDGGNAVAVNQGRVTTRGGAADDLPGAVGTLLGSTGVSSFARYNAYAENALTGRVDTYGERAFGLMAESYAGGFVASAIADVVNSGQVHTRGHNADGVLAIIYNGTVDNPNYARATNAAGASITTTGAGSGGLTAGIFIIEGDDTIDAPHSIAIARNDGTVVTGQLEENVRDPSGEVMPPGTRASNGVTAAFFPAEGTTFTNAGDVAVVNTGDVTVQRENATGLYAETFGTGKVTMRVVGGSVSAYGENGRGLWARTGTTGTIDAVIAESSGILSNGTAAEFDGGSTNVRLLDSSLFGDVDFGNGYDIFTVRNGWVTGAIDFGDGLDALNVHGDTWLEGTIGNLESLHKFGPGNLVLRDDAVFSSGAFASLAGGGLVFTGQFNLGNDGMMYINDAARLTAVLADPSAPPRITAGGGITFGGDKELFVQVAPWISARDEAEYLRGFDDTSAGGTNPIANHTPVSGRDGYTDDPVGMVDSVPGYPSSGGVALRTARGPSTVVDIGHIPLDPLATCTAIGCPDVPDGPVTITAGTTVTHGVRLGVFDFDMPADEGGLTIDGLPEIPLSLTRGQSGPGLTLGGGVSALGAALFGVFDAEWASPAPDEVPESVALVRPGYFDTRARDDDAEYRARAWSGATPVLAGGAQARLQGAEVGVRTPLERGFLLGISATPEVSVSTSGGETHLDGRRYAVQGGWRGETFHAVASVSQGRYLARSVSDNPVAGGGLAGTFGLTQDHLRLGAGARLGWRGVRLAPSLSLHSGVLNHDAHTAEGAVFRADVPAFSQRYHGWKSELTLSSEQWLRGPESLRWRPALHLYTQRTQTTGPASVEVAQHDGAGVLSMTSSAQISGLPRTVHGFDATVEAMRSQMWRVQLGFAGMHSDGEYDQALFARLHKRF